MLFNLLIINQSLVIINNYTQKKKKKKKERTHLRLIGSHNKDGGFYKNNSTIHPTFMMIKIE